MRPVFSLKFLRKSLHQLHKLEVLTNNAKLQVRYFLELQWDEGLPPGLLLGGPFSSHPDPHRASPRLLLPGGIECPQVWHGGWWGCPLLRAHVGIPSSRYTPTIARNFTSLLSLK